MTTAYELRVLALLKRIAFRLGLITIMLSAVVGMTVGWTLGRLP